MAAERTVKVIVRAEINAFKSDMAAAAKAAQDTAKKTEEAGKKAESGIGRLSQTASAHEKAWGQVSTGLVAGGVAIVGGLTLATKAAMEWESAWTGVLKTVDGTPAQLAEIESGLRGLAKTLPSTHTEIAGVAEAAGQLGVARKDVVGFTETMIGLGESTNLTAEDAATNIAQISNVMGTMARDGVEGVSRFSATLVALGNDGASTEAEILSMAQRIAGAGATIGATEGEVLALSNTLASMGVRAELGGGVTTRVLLKMYSAVQEGGETLDSFARTAGMSADQFAEAFKSSPVEALDAVNKGLFRVKSEGGNVVSTMKDLGIKGTEETQVMLALAESGNLLSDSLSLQSKAWQENSAHTDESSKRYETAESRIKIAWNNIKDSAIDAGGAILPIVATLADAVAGIASVFGSIPGPVQTGLVSIAAVTGVAALAAGSLMKLSANALSTIGGIQALAKDSPRAASALTGLSKAAGAAAVAIVGITVAKEVIEAVNEAARSGKPDLEAYFNILSTGGGKNLADGLKFDLGDGARSGLQQFEGVTKEAQVAHRALERLGTMNDALLGRWWSEHISMGDTRREIDEALELEKALQALGKAFALGEVEKGQKAFADFATELGFTDEKVAQMINQIPELKAALMEVATEGGIQIDPDDQLGLVDLALGRVAASAPVAESGLKGITGGLGESAEAAEAAAKALDEFYSGLVKTGQTALSERDALRAVEAAIDAASDAAKKNGKTLDDNTPKGRANADALDAIASSTLNAVERQHAMGRSAGELAATMESGRDAYIKQAVALGMNEKAAGKLADRLMLIPEAVFTDIETNADSVSLRVQELYDWVKASPDGKIQIDDNSPEVRATLEALGFVVKNLPNGQIEVSEKGTDATGKKIDATAKKKREAKITTSAITAAAETAINNAARDRKTTVTVGWAVMAPPSAISETRNKMFNPGGKMHGGRIPRNAAGSRLPSTGPGTDKRDGILGITGDGTPLSWLDGGEWVINRKSSGKHNDLLRMINNDDPLVDFMKSLTIPSDLTGLATGGRAGWSQGQDKNLQAAAARATAARKQAERDVKDAERGASRTSSAYSKIDGKKANKGRKASAKRESDAAKQWVKNEKSALDRLKKAEDEAKKKLQDSKARTARLSEGAFDLRRENKRGTITEAFTSGSGMSVVDRMFEASNNQDLSKKQRANMRSLAYKTENELLRLEKRAEKNTAAFAKAKDARDDLLNVRNGVRDQVSGAFDMGAMLGQKDAYGYSKGVGKKGLLSYGKSLAAGAKTLSQKVKKLQQAGFHESMISQAIDEWSNDGTFVLADAMLSMNKSEAKSFNQSFKDLETYGTRTGNHLTEAMAKGGLNAAQTLVSTLGKEEKNIDAAFYKLGKAGERGFNRAWGIASPSKVMEKNMGWIGEGGIRGLKAQEPAMAKAMADFVEFPQSAALEVPAYAAAASHRMAQPAPAVQTVAATDAMIETVREVVGEALRSWKVEVGANPRTMGVWYQKGRRYNETHR